MAIAEEVLFSNDIRSTIRKHTTNVKSEIRRHKIRKYSDLIASHCILFRLLINSICTMINERFSKKIVTDLLTDKVVHRGALVLKIYNICLNSEV